MQSVISRLSYAELCKVKLQCIALAICTHHIQQSLDFKLKQTQAQLPVYLKYVPTCMHVHARLV